MTASFCQPCAAMIMPTISRTISKATSESRAGNERPNTLILTLLLLRSELERDVLLFLRVELISVYSHWCAEFPRTLIFHRIAEKGSSRKLSRHKKQLSLKSRGQSVRWPPGSAVPEDSVEDN